MKIKKNISGHNLIISFAERISTGFRIHSMNRSGGQASIEFAFVLPVLIIIILIVSQLGYLVYLQNVLEHAAREGARVLVTTNSDNSAYECIYRICSIMESEKLDIEVVPASQNQRKLGDVISVRLKYSYSGFAGIARMFPGDCILVSSSCSMRMECGNE